MGTLTTLVSLFRRNGDTNLTKMKLKADFKLVISILIILFTLSFGTAVMNLQETAQQNDSASGQQVAVKDCRASNKSNETLIRSIRSANALVSPLMVSSSDIVLDISPNATRYVEWRHQYRLRGISGRKRQPQVRIGDGKAAGRCRHIP